MTVTALSLSLFNHEQDIELLKALHYLLRSNQFKRKVSPVAAQSKGLKKPKAPLSEGKPIHTVFQKPSLIRLSEMLRLGKCQTSKRTIVSVVKFDIHHPQ